MKGRKANYKRRLISKIPSKVYNRYKAVKIAAKVIVDMIENCQKDSSRNFNEGGVNETLEKRAIKNQAFRDKLQRAKDLLETPRKPRRDEN